MPKTAKQLWEIGANVRQREYLNRLKERDFFKWKARRSYIMLSATQLRDLWNQQHGLCALTGTPLDKSAELDHVIPISKGGDNSYGNSRWLCRAANQAKRDLTDSDFFSLLSNITKSRAYTEWIGQRLMETL